MKYLLTFFISVIFLSGFSQTETNMNDSAAASYHKADAELNKIYKTILSEYKSDTLFIKNLKASQRIWITFRDAELKVKFPETAPGYYGSIFPMCYSGYMEQLTRERIVTLKQWTEGIEEGDVCAGSVKVKQK